jgi:glycosyltransferase involved in cell wall biosynthesis
MAVGTPVLCNARSDVLVDHCTRSNAGLFYADRDEFVECVNRLLADERLRAAMGRNGRSYVRRNYHWDVIMSKYDTLMAALPQAAGIP